MGVISGFHLTLLIITFLVVVSADSGGSEVKQPIERSHIARLLAESVLVSLDHISIGTFHVDLFLLRLVFTPILRVTIRIA